MTKIKDDYDLLESARERAMHSSVSVLEALSRAKDMRKAWEGSIERDDSGEDDSQGDALFDLLRLNATYLNEASKLGRRYGTQAFRALEGLYKLANPGVAPLVLTRDEPNATFTVKNDVSKQSSVTLSIPNIEYPRGGRAFGLRGHVGVRGQDSRIRYEIDVPHGEEVHVEAQMDFDGFRRIKIEDEIRVVLHVGAGGSRVRRVPLAIDNTARRERRP